MIECYESNCDDVDSVQDFLLKPDLPSQLPGEPNNLYTERKGIRDIKAVGIYENYHDLIDENITTRCVQSQHWMSGYK